MRSYEIHLSDDQTLLSLDLLKVGEFKSKTHGHFRITKVMLQEAKDNFYKNIHRQTTQDGNPMIPLNFSHDKGREAAGWIKELELNDSGTVLIGTAELTPIGREKITNKEYAFTSAEFSFEMEDPELNQTFRNVLTGAALTNIPFMRGLRAIELTKKEFQMEEILKLINDLTDEEKVILIEKLKSMIETDPSIDAEKDKKMFSQLEDKIKKLEEDNITKAKELEFTNLLAEGKVVPAQKDAYIKGDIKTLIEKSENKLNFSQSSSSNQGGSDGEEIKTAEEAENKVIELSKEMAKKESISEVEAQRQVLITEPKLADLINS